jgi:hypothetical protein
VRIRLLPKDAVALAECEAEVGKLPEDLIVAVQPERQWAEIEASPFVVGGILRDGVAWVRAG